MDTYTTVKNRILYLCEEKKMTINKLATNSGIAPSTIKNILYGKSQNPGIVTLKMLCDGLEISLIDFFNTDDFKNLEQEIK
ncbi:MAG: helix-turn-helix transcriptional regulator [Oscillospiraceae bacterium]|nr:helix-turn-helix transcriptional regulator [Oscillospiraceae bacterium]MBQ6902243.1 helix-turn-helix transcriptional regulator [Oscillospiraceae bacterium]